MRTEDDLRAACTALADRAPAPDESRIVIPAGDPGPVRRTGRRSLLVGVAVATATAAVATPLIIRAAGDRSARSPQATVDPDDWRQPILTLELPAGWYRTATTVSTHSERIASTNGPGPNAATCTVEVFRHELFDIKRIAAGSARLTVNGRPGYYGRVGPDWTQEPATSRASAVVWEYADESWAMSSCNGSLPSARTVMQHMAQGSTFSGGMLTMPVAIGYVPAGMGIQYATAEPAPPFGRKPIATVGLAPICMCPIPPTDEQLTTLIEVRPDGDRPDPGAGSTRTTIGGRRAWFYRSGNLERLQVQYGDYYVGLALQRTLPNVRNELRTMAEHLRVARAPGNPSTWFDSIEALPQR